MNRTAIQLSQHNFEPSIQMLEVHFCSSPLNAGNTVNALGNRLTPGKILYRHRPQIALQEKDGVARAGDKLGRHPTQSQEKMETVNKT